MRVADDLAVVAPLAAAGYVGWITADAAPDAAALGAARERLAEAGID